MTFTLLSVVVIFILTTIACLEIYRGIKRGFLLSLINLGNIAVSLLLSFAVTSLISSFLSSFLIGKLRTWVIYQSIVQELISMETLILAAVEMIVSAILFLIVFCILRMILFRIFYGIYQRRSAIDDDPGYGREDHSCATSLTKKRGAVCGGIAAFLITMITISPIMGTLELATNIFSIIENASPQAISSIGKGNVSLVKEFSNDFAGNVFYRLGGRWIYSNAASAKMEEKRVYLLSEIEVVESVSGDILKIYEILQNPHNTTQEHLDALERLRKNLQKTEACEQLIGEAIGKCSAAWKAGYSYFGLRRPAMNAMVEPMFMDVLDVCAKTTSSSAKKNANTILEIYGILLESEFFGSDFTDYDQVLSLMARHETIERIDQAMAKNPNMDEINASSMMLKTFFSYIQSLQLTDQAYADFVQNIAAAINIVNESEGNPQDWKKRELAAYAASYFAEIGMNISEEVAEMFSSELLEEFSNTDATAAKIKFIFEKYKNG